MSEPTYLGELINLSFRDLLKIPLVENNHHVTYIDEYTDIICDKFNADLRRNGTFDDMVVRFTEKDFAHIPNKFFNKCNIIVSYHYDNRNWYDGGYNVGKTIVDEDESTMDLKDISIDERKFKNVYFEIVIKLFGNSLDEINKNLRTTIGHEMTHALQHIRMKMAHNESFTDKNYINSYRKIITDADLQDDINLLKERLALFLYYTDANERKANISEFYNEIGYITEDDITSRENIMRILESTKLWEIIKVMGEHISYYNKLNDSEIQEKLITYYNEYFKHNPITTYRQFKRAMNGRWNSFYGGLAPKLISMIREKARNGQRLKLYGPKRPMKIK